MLFCDDLVISELSQVHLDNSCAAGTVWRAKVKEPVVEPFEFSSGQAESTEKHAVGNASARFFGRPSPIKLCNGQLIRFQTEVVERRPETANEGVVYFENVTLRKL